MFSQYVVGEKWREFLSSRISSQVVEGAEEAKSHNKNIRVRPFTSLGQVSLVPFSAWDKVQSQTQFVV